MEFMVSYPEVVLSPDPPEPAEPKMVVEPMVEVIVSSPEVMVVTMAEVVIAELGSS